MDNVNVVVLIVAIVFVAAGVTLIALSAVVGRAKRSEGTDEETATPVDAAAQEPAEAGEPTLFIDEPLTTDMAEQLAEPERGKRSAETHEESAAAEETAAAPPAAAEAPAGPDPFDFSVKMGFTYLKAGLVADAVAEFQTAAGHADDRAQKLSLFTRVGDAFSERGMSGPAYASYLQATAYADDEQTRTDLEQALSNLDDTELTASVTADPSGDEEE